ncbi:hypothetical protein SAMN05216469_102400 [Ruminococcus albus]|uniref:Uncharacterized protein n=2 Tax=Ruminococcus albus TaxID=1264 RepID=A0A1H7H9G6_RUMAL|nr:hypothetical protein SAMN05216469_102400 [Ruminococcus albus]
MSIFLRLTDIAVLLFAFIFPIVRWFKKPLEEKRQLSFGNILNITGNMFEPLIAMLFLINSLFNVGHGEKLYTEMAYSDDGIVGVVMVSIVIFLLTLIIGVANRYKPKDYLKKGLLHWLIGLAITGQHIILNLTIKKHPEKFINYDVYTVSEMKTKCVPCALIGSSISLAVCIGLCILIWYRHEIRDRKDIY